MDFTFDKLSSCDIKEEKMDCEELKPMDSGLIPWYIARKIPQDEKLFAYIISVFRKLVIE
ncbi:hypothetical protein SK128_023369, partial [Halocaridina rubra]